MNKHTNHVDYICTKARNAMGWGALGYYGKFSIHNPYHLRIEGFVTEWIDRKVFLRNKNPILTEKCRKLAIRLIERNGGFKRTLAALKANSEYKAWTVFNRERF